MKRKISAVLAMLLLLAALNGCTNPDTKTTSARTDSGSTEISGSTETSENAGDATEIAASLNASDMFTERDQDAGYDEDKCVRIRLNGDSAEASSDSVQISGTTVTITEEAAYIISGTLDDGMIIVDAPDTAKLQLILNGVDINSETSTALYICEADKVFVTLAEGTENTLSNGGTFTAIDDNNIDAALFSKQDLTLNGSGTLTVLSPAGHGIVCKDDLIVTGGTFNITSASHGVDANDSIRITGDTAFTIDAGKDGMHAENDEDTSLGFVYISGGTFDIEAEGDGISAGSCIQIENGTFEILAGGGSENGTRKSSDDWGQFRGEPPMGFTKTSAGEAADESTAKSDSESDSSSSMKGIKAAGNLSVSGGNFQIDSADDSVHSNASILLNGGSFEIASGDDAFHADETLTVTDGTILITDSYEGLEALHLYIQGGDITLTADDDGLNAAGGTDASGTSGGRDGMFGGGNLPEGNQPDNMPGNGEPGNGMSASSGGSIAISGGTLYINASGDGIDANGSIEISGGYTVVTGPTQGDTATLDYDTSAVITGGTFIGTGASGMAQTFSSSEQGVLTVNAGGQAAGTAITITDANGNVLLEHSPELPFDIILFSSPDVVSGETYTITAGSVSVEVEAQ